jgi:hypothetical protein
LAIRGADVPTLSRPPLTTEPDGFSAQEFAFALAWELYAPGLGGWTVQRDTEDEGDQIILVDPPLVYGDGFMLRKDAEGVRITSPIGVHRAATLRDALLLICPLGREALDSADQMAALPNAELMR